MSEQSEVVAKVERRYTESMRLSARLYDLRVLAAALALSGLLAAATTLALTAPWAWLLVLGLLVATGFGFVRATRGVRAARALLFAFPPIDGDVTDVDREALTSLAPFKLEPSLVAQPEQLDRLLKPTSQDSATQLREVPGQLVAVVGLGLLSFLGISMSLAIPAFVIIGPETVSSSPWVAIVFFAGLPLALLSLHLVALTDVARDLYAQQVIHAEQELPRLWVSAPGFSAGRVVQLEVHGYSINHSALPIKPSSSLVSQLLRILVPVALGLYLLLAGLDELSTRYLPAV